MTKTMCWQSVNGNCVSGVGVGVRFSVIIKD